MSLKQIVWLPESWLAILRRLSAGKWLLRVLTDEDDAPLLFPSGSLMVKLSAYFSRGSSRESTWPFSHSLYSISVGKILERLAILKSQ